MSPLRAVWWLFTNLRFAIVLLGVLCVVSLVGVVLPQKPIAVRHDSMLEADWLHERQAWFGFLTGPMDRFQLFDIFHAGWFEVLLLATSVSTAAYIASRAPASWRAIARPRKRVPDRYFRMAPIRLEVTERVDPAELESRLRRARYKVETEQQGPVTYLFADRFPWAGAGSLLAHSAIVLFIVAGALSRSDAFSSPLFLAEGSTLPVFPVRDANQMQVELADSHAEFAADGQPLDYHSDLVIYLRGEEVKRCRSTVNTPCRYSGYRFYQSAYFGFGAAVQVRDLRSGNVIYSETLALSETAPAPHVTIRDAEGTVLLDQPVVLTDSFDAKDFSYRGALVRLPNERLLAIGLQTGSDGGDERLTVIEPGEGGHAAVLSLAETESGESGGLTVSYSRRVDIPSGTAPDLPLPDTTDSSMDGPFLQLSNVPYGTGRVSEGDGPRESRPGGPAVLTIAGLQPRALRLEPGQSATFGEYEYTFLDQREFAGIDVRRDRSDYLVWAAVAMILTGLMLTFWVPRRRLWARISSTGTSLAGQAPAHAGFVRELQKLLEKTAENSAEGPRPNA